MCYGGCKGQQLASGRLGNRDVEHHHDATQVSWASLAQTPSVLFIAPGVGLCVFYYGSSVYAA